MRSDVTPVVRARSLLGAAALLGILPAAGWAQTVLVRALQADTSAPVVGALAYLVADDGRTVKSTLTDDRGRALFVGIPEGAYRIRMEMIGMATSESALFEVGEETTITDVIRLQQSAIELEGLEVELESDRCAVRPRAEGVLVAKMWDEARKALAAASLTEARGLYRYETTTYERELDRDTGVVLSEEQSRREGYMTTPYESYPAEDLVENGFVQDQGAEEFYMAPDAAVLLSDAFLDTHCFHVVEPEGESGGLVGLGFRPTGGDKSVPDIAGTMWIDPVTAELRWLEYTYQHLEPERTSRQVGGRVDFERMPDGTWIVRKWWIRMPVMAARTDFQGRALRYISRYHEKGGLVLAVREAGGRRLARAAQTGGIEGVVRDSLGVPVRGVRVGVVGSNLEVYTNSEGEFGITRLGEGRYHVRIVDPYLQTAGYIAEPVMRDVIPGEMSYLEIQLPSLADVLFDECRGADREADEVALAGTVVNGFGTPVPGATVHVQWMRYDFRGVVTGRRGDDLREIPHTREIRSDARGSFVLCDVPAAAPINLYASREDARSEVIELVIPETEVGAVRVLQLPN